MPRETPTTDKQTEQHWANTTPGHWFGEKGNKQIIYFVFIDGAEKIYFNTVSIAKCTYLLCNVFNRLKKQLFIAKLIYEWLFNQWIAAKLKPNIVGKVSMMRPCLLIYWQAAHDSGKWSWISIWLFNIFRNKSSVLFSYLTCHILPEAVESCGFITLKIKIRHKQPKKYSWKTFFYSLNGK